MAPAFLAGSRLPEAPPRPLYRRVVEPDPAARFVVDRAGNLDALLSLGTSFYTYDYPKRSFDLAVMVLPASCSGTFSSP